MAINLNKNRETILAAWKDVVDDKSPTDWALFSYEGQSNDLKVVSKGDGGIEEMREDLNSGKIMYAFCRVLDPKTSLHKFILINWTGEGAPNLRKGTCANHIRDVSNMLKGAHVTINARNEEEVDPEIIVDKVSKATGSAYSFKERGETVKESGPVGTTYKRVIPCQEINAKERDQFWQKEEEEEKRRQEEERKRKEEERRRTEMERKQRELEETAMREARIKERSESITLQREAENIERGRGGERIRDEDETEEREREERERRARSELLRRQRSQEAQAVISKRTFDARAVFEQNTSAGQLNQRRASYQPSTLNSSASPVKEVVSPVSERVRWPPVAHQQQIAQKQENIIIPHGDAVKPSSGVDTTVVDKNVGQAEQPARRTMELAVPVVNNQTVEESKQPQPAAQVPAQETIKSNQPNQREQELYHNPGVEIAQPYLDDSYVNGGVILEDDDEDLGLRAQALYDYQAADDTEISFDPGDIITHIDQIDAGWWQGLGPDGNFGLFPANYVQLLD